jgi:hypothetical protein
VPETAEELSRLSQPLSVPPGLIHSGSSCTWHLGPGAHLCGVMSQGRFYSEEEACSLFKGVLGASLQLRSSSMLHNQADDGLIYSSLAHDILQVSLDFQCTQLQLALGSPQIVSGFYSLAQVIPSTWDMPTTLPPAPGSASPLPPSTSPSPAPGSCWL